MLFSRNIQVKHFLSNLCAFLPSLGITFTEMNIYNIYNFMKHKNILELTLKYISMKMNIISIIEHYNDFTNTISVTLKLLCLFKVKVKLK